MIPAPGVLFGLDLLGRRLVKCLFQVYECACRAYFEEVSIGVPLKSWRRSEISSLNALLDKYWFPLSKQNSQDGEKIHTLSLSGKSQTPTRSAWITSIHSSKVCPANSSVSQRSRQYPSVTRDLVGLTLIIDGDIFHSLLRPILWHDIRNRSQQ